MHDVLHHVAGRVGSELREAHDGAAQVGRAREDRLVEAVDALGGRSQGTQSRPHEIGDRAHRTTDELDADVPTSTIPATEVAIRSGRTSAIASVAIAPML